MTADRDLWEPLTVDGLIDTILKVAAYGLHDSNRDDLRAYALAARDALTPTGKTPLTALLPHLDDRRAYHALKHGRPKYGAADVKPITSVEQVAAMDDDDLLDLRNVGPVTVYKIRKAVAAALGTVDRPEPHRPDRRSDVMAWLVRHRQEFADAQNDIDWARWGAIDILVEDYRDHADFGVPLDRDVEGPHPEESAETAGPCSYPGCGRPTAYMPARDGSGYGWRHVLKVDEVNSHVGYPMPRTGAE